MMIVSESSIAGNSVKCYRVNRIYKMNTKLSRDQQDILDQYQSLSGSDETDANIKTLVRFDWNLERAVNSLLDENFANAMNDPSLPGPSNSASYRQQPSTTSPVGIQRPTSSWGAILTKPIYWSFRLLWKVINLTLSFLPFWHNSDKRIKAGLSDRELVQQYQKDFDDKYGATGLQFFVGSYLQALDKAKADLKFLLVILQSDDHDDTDKFSRDTLVNPLFVDYIIQHDILVWYGTVQQSQGYKVALGLDVDQYPFMAVLALHENKMKLVHRFEGIHPAQQCVDAIDILIRRMQPNYKQMKAERLF